jgi:hypothetical protein
MPYFARFTDSRWYAAAEPIPTGPTISLMRDLARQYAMVIVAPIYELDGQARYNSAAVIDADGKYLGVYRKHHVPTYHTGNYEPFYFHLPDLASGLTPRGGSAYTSATTATFFPKSRHLRLRAQSLQPSATGGKNSNESGSWNSKRMLNNGYFLGRSTESGAGTFDVGFWQELFLQPLRDHRPGGKGTEEIVIADLDLDDWHNRNTAHNSVHRSPPYYIFRIIRKCEPN